MYCDRIELKRKQMLDFAKKYGFTAEITVKCSQELDKLLNCFQIRSEELKN